MKLLSFGLRPSVAGSRRSLGSDLKRPGYRGSLPPAKVSWGPIRNAQGANFRRDAGATRRPFGFWMCLEARRASPGEGFGEFLAGSRRNLWSLH